MLENQEPAQYAETGNVLEVRGMTKSFGAVQALRGVDFSLRKGEIHALVGEYGAGKSTLISILSGMSVPDEGQVLINGQEIVITSLMGSLAKGISAVTLDLTLISDLTVAENIYIDNLSSKMRIINKKVLHADTRKLLDELGFGFIPVDCLVSQLGVAYQQIVEIARAVVRQSMVLMLDEPTAALTLEEAGRLHALVQRLKARGISIIYTSHQLGEIFEVCDRATILSNGQVIDTIDLKDADEETLVSRMIDHESGEAFPSHHSAAGEVLFRISGISGAAALSFHVCAGEVLGLCGCAGAGRRETLVAILEKDKPDGVFLVKTQEEKKRSSLNDMFNQFFATLVHPDRRRNSGSLSDLPVKESLTLGNLREFIQFTGAQEKSLHAAGAKTSGRNHTPDLHLETKSRIFLFDEPSRKVDQRKKAEIYQSICELAGAGHGILLISSAIPEIIGLCDRAAVIRDGEMAGELSKEALTEENLIHLLSHAPHSRENVL